jgi:signal transduction histidine kinase
MNDGTHWLDHIAHDLRGPLTPLQTAAYLLRREQEHLDPQRQQELLDIIERQSRRLARMIDEFGDWSRLQQQRLLGESAPCELSSLFDLAIGATPGCMIEPQLPPQCSDARIDCDQFRMVQALKILLEYSTARDANASLHVACDDTHARLQLRDRGPALDATATSLLLKRPDPAPADEGLGLRLLLARAIIEAHGGTLAAASTPDGLALDCTLPMATPARS